MVKKTLVFTLIVLALVFASAGTTEASPVNYEGDPERGEYFAWIMGCIGCHTPQLGDDPMALDFDNAFSGGRPFDLGPLGIVFTKNLTSDVETGLGGWTDQEIKTAVKTGISRDGLHLFPIMPYPHFSGMADQDLDDLVAFLRSLPAISNTVERVQILPPEALPQIPYLDGIVAPDPSDTAARGRYLINSVIACTDCHTPVDPETGAPILDMYLGGSQPFEGPWGVIYGGNLTPHETGLADWTDDEVKRVIRTGVRKDGRLAILMPSVEYARLTDEDLDAVVYFLRNDLAPVDNVIPQAALNEGFEIFADLEEPAPERNPMVTYAFVGIVVVLAVVVIVLSNRKKPEEEA